MTPKTVAIGTALAVAGVLLGMNYPIAEAQPDGPYALAAGGGANGQTYVWRMNLPTGEVSVCGLLAPQLIFSTITPQDEIERLRAERNKALREGGFSEKDIAEYEAHKVKAEAAELFTPQCSPWGPTAKR